MASTTTTDIQALRDAAEARARTWEDSAWRAYNDGDRDAGDRYQATADIYWAQVAEYEQAAQAPAVRVPDASRQLRADMRRMDEEQPPSMAPEFEPDTFTPALNRMHALAHPGIDAWLYRRVYGFPHCTPDDEAAAIEVFGPEGVDYVYRFGPY